MVMRSIMSLLLLWSAADSLGSDRIQFQSGTNHSSLIELYTSEGCSSCPPAEEWLSHLKVHPGLWVDFVPIAFHVDYWDYLGWRDPYGEVSNSDRQRAYATEWKARSVYTPGFVLDGKEWHNRGSRNEAPRRTNDPSGVLSVSSEDRKAWSLRFEPRNYRPGDSYVFQVALLGCDLVSDVKSGENRGRKLQHDFVVLTTARAESTRSENGFQAVTSLPISAQSQPARMCIACWVTRGKGLEPLQAVGGWLPMATR
jgi:hypothetical protein